MSNKPKDTSKLIKRLIAHQLGTDPDDIEEDDSLTSDLLMKASDLTDLIETMEAEGFDTSSIDLTDLDTVSDLIEKLTDEI